MLYPCGFFNPNEKTNKAKKGDKYPDERLESCVEFSQSFSPGK